MGGVAVRLYKTGQGAPVLFIHGITTYSFIWRRVVDLLQNHYCLYVPDLPGCGDSSMDTRVSYSLKTHAERMAELLQAQVGEKVHLVGHDLGGGIAQLMAVEYPELIRSLVLVNSVGYDYWPVQPITALRAPVLRQLIVASFDLGTLKLVVQRGLYHKEKADAELLSLFMRPLQTAAGRMGLLHFARCLDNRNLLDIAHLLPRVTLPTLVVRGDADVYLSPVISQRLVEDFPQANLVRIATAGHFIQEDEPRWLCEKLREFWEGQGGGLE